MNQFSNNNETTYFTVQALNLSKTNSNTLTCSLSQQSNPIVQNLSDYDIFLQSLTCSTAELPYFNIYRQIAWDQNNFVNNCTNMTISILLFDNNNPYPFNLAGNTNQLLVGCGGSNGAGMWQGVTAYLRYVSENGLSNGVVVNGDSQNQSIEYFAVHSIQQFIDMINNALVAIAGVPNGGIFVNNAYQYYFYFDPISQLYNFVAPMTFPTSNLEMYVNSYLEYKLDNFRWEFYGNSIVVAPPLAINNLVTPYQGLDNLFVKKNYPQNLLNNIYTYPSEYSALSNLIDIHSLLVVSNAGQLQSVRQQIIPSSTLSTANSQLNLPTISCLKALDIELSGLNIASINNTYIQYENTGPFWPINSLINQQLTNISISIYIQDIDNYVYPLMLPAGGGYANVRLALVKKEKKLIK